ncbi:MAG: hypothetical protein LIP06_09595 [Tannerellaceae bacterium]|nr:hypothetical protein [Tannerellaceae bacterium]
MAVLTTRLKFKKSKQTNEMTGFVSLNSKTGNLRGVKENSQYQKKVCVLAKDLSNRELIVEDVLYNVSVVPMKSNNGFVVVSATPVPFEAKINALVIPKVTYKVTATFGHKTVYYDPLDGKSSASNTLQGALDELESRKDLANKEQVIADFKRQAIILQQRMQEDGYNIFSDYNPVSEEEQSLEKRPIGHPVEIDSIIIPRAIYRITLKFGKNVILFDPLEGADNSTKTLPGVMGIIKSRNDIQNKDLVIQNFRKQANLLINQMDVDGYYTKKIRGQKA